MAKPITTIDDLAELMMPTMASKEDIQAVREDVKAVRGGVAPVNGRLDRIEEHRLADYGRRIESLEPELK